MFHCDLFFFSFFVLLAIVCTFVWYLFLSMLFSKSFLSISLTNACFVFRNNVHFVTQTIFAHINSFSVNQFVCLLFVCLSESMSILFFYSYILYFFLSSCQYRPLKLTLYDINFSKFKMRFMVSALNYSKCLLQNVYIAVYSF